MESRFIRVLLGALLLTPFVARPAAADMGSVYGVDIGVREESQKAVILHNGEQEVLILGTDLQADTRGGILRFIPFPSAPSVSLAPAGVFDRVLELAHAHRLQFIEMTKGGSRAAPVQLLLHQRLGSHDITLVKVKDAAHFRRWVNDFFAARKLPLRDAYPAVEEVVQDYVSRGIDYFVLDFVEVGTDPRTVDPVVYRFASKSVYYPLKTSNTFGGSGAIELFVVSPRTLCDPMESQFHPCLQLFERVSTSSRVTPAELAPIEPDAAAFFGTGNLYLQMLAHWGAYEFDRDLLTDPMGGVDEALEPERYEYDGLRERFGEILSPEQKQ